MGGLYGGAGGALHPPGISEHLEKKSKSLAHSCQELWFFKELTN